MIKSSSICFTSRYSVGVTFLIWSYYWLAGYDQHWLMKDSKKIDLVTDPNTGINAHNFRKNYHEGCHNWKLAMETYAKQQNDRPICFYGGPLHHGDQEIINQDYVSALKIASREIPTVLVVESSADPFYFVKPRGYTDPSGIHCLAQEIYSKSKVENHLSTYFKESSQQFDKHIWDMREVLALNYRSMLLDRSYIDDIDWSSPLLYIDSRQLWFDGEELLHHILSWLDTPVQSSRLENWNSRYKTWQKTQMDVLDFGWNLPHIIASIVHGYSYDLSRFNLDLQREAVIQGILIEQHGLNFRTWGLDRFPDNTLDLHRLLEPNCHRK